MNDLIEDTLANGSKRVRWMMPPALPGDAPYVIEIITNPDGSATVNGDSVKALEPPNQNDNQEQGNG